MTQDAKRDAAQAPALEMVVAGSMRRIAEQEGRAPAEVEADFLRYISMRCKVVPEDIADMAVFLSSDGARRVTGRIVAVDGHIESER